MLFADYADANGVDHVVVALNPSVAGASRGRELR